MSLKPLTDKGYLSIFNPLLNPHPDMHDVRGLKEYVNKKPLG